MLIITGTSKGIGLAIARDYLSRGEKVIGIGRSHSLVHENYTSIYCNLVDREEVANIPLNLPVNEPITFIHNAGILGSVERFSEGEKNNLPTVFQVNVFAGFELLQRLLSQLQLSQPLTVIMISSGAAKRAIPSWAAYCASKAALEILTETIYHEEMEKGRKQVRFYAVAPGVVDTAMQAQIRSVEPQKFSSHENFVGYYERNELYSPEIVAKKLQKLLEMPYEGKISCSLRDIEI